MIVRGGHNSPYPEMNSYYSRDKVKDYAWPSRIGERLPGIVSITRLRAYCFEFSDWLRFL